MLFTVSTAGSGAGGPGGDGAPAEDEGGLPIGMIAGAVVGVRTLGSGWAPGWSAAARPQKEKT